MAARFLLALTCLAGALFLVACATPGCAPAQPATNLETVTIKGRTFHLELANDTAARTQGLMYRESIPEDGGMLFVFTESMVRSFWMKNCLIDIDLIFLDPRGRVTALHEMKALPPQGDDESDAVYEARMHAAASWSRYPAQFAIELKAGTLAQLDLHIEDQIELDLARLKAAAH